jgi:adenine deaminase
VQSTDFEVEAETKHICVIKAIDGELITEEEIHKAKIENNKLVADIENDILKIAVVNRYQKAKPAVAFIRGFGLKKGAIASSVGHDSHNITVVGTNDDDIAKAVNLIMESKGGLSAVCGDEEQFLPLPVAGLMSLNTAETVAHDYSQILSLSKRWGSPLRSPFMTLSFMPLLVIPALKLSDKGLFDARNFSFKSIFAAHA